MQFLVVTGMSGAGRTQATKFLEDLGFFCIDNIPSMLLPKFSELYLKNEMEIERLALVMDVRGGDFYQDLMRFVSDLQRIGRQADILFLDCADDVLVKRYKENRRLHPLAQDGNNLEGIRQERERLSELKRQATYVIDTTNASIWDLKKEIYDIFGSDRRRNGLKVHVISFGYKYGLPGDCDLLFDVRFLPNPYYVPELRQFTGNDEAVRNYVVPVREAAVFLDKLQDLLKFLLPLYAEEGKEVLVIGIGCTGGRHRSVALANEMVKRLSAMGYAVSLEHRDIGK